MATMNLRWAQLDLARQMETIEFIHGFIDFLAGAGYNGLLLYLEDRVRTASYQLAAEGEYYTEAEMRELAAFGAARGIELVPCVATLGHAERFLRHPEMRRYAELPDGETGRFGGVRKNTFCITHPEFYDFMGGYLREVAALFPSRWFHIGLDEFWDFKMCPRCRALMPTLADEQRFFLEHIKTVREIMAAAGKRVMMWSDMFEFYPDVFPAVPKDVVMVDWQYQRDVRSYLGHLLDVGVEDRIAVNAANGFDTVVAPADRMLSNAASYLAYAEERSVLGGLITSWEKSDTFLYRTLPVFAAAGRQMQGETPDAAFVGAMCQIFGETGRDPIFAAMVKLALNQGFWRHFEAVHPGTIFTRNFFGMAYDEMESDFAAFTILPLYRDRITAEWGRRCLDDMLNGLTEKVVSHRLKKTAHDTFDRGVTPARRTQFDAAANDYRQFLDRMAALWEAWRPGIAPNVFAANRERVSTMLAQEAADLASGAWVRVACCLPDGFGVENCRIELKMDGGWMTAGEGVFKADRTDTTLFERFLPLPENCAGKLEAIRIAASGLGGIGVTFVEVRLGGRRFVPRAVLAVSGRVENVTHLLDNDLKFTWFGGQSTRDDYFDRHAAVQIHSATLEMAEFRTDKLAFAE